MINKQYVAGFLDGEGAVGISVNKSTAGYPIPGLRVSFANFHLGVIQKIQRRWGGSISSNKNEVNILSLNGEGAYRLLVDIGSYTIIKRRPAELAIVFFEIPFVSPDENPPGYIKKLEAALAVMYETRKGYKAERGTKMIDTLEGAINHVFEHLKQAAPATR